ncbi:MAG: integrase, partial [Castellaniella sp.]
FTRSRPRHSNDNALVEAKNGVVIRRTFGYAHIPQKHARPINAFCEQHLVPYLNLLRPCLFPEQTIDAKGKIRTTYPQALVRTPPEKLHSLPARARGLKPGITLQSLLIEARAMSDNEAAEQLQKARSALFATIHRRSADKAA